MNIVWLLHFIVCLLAQSIAPISISSALQDVLCVIVHDTCAAIVSVLFDQYIKFPNGNELERVVKGFEEKWNMVQCAGAIDGSHVPVRPPASM